MTSAVHQLPQKVDGIFVGGGHNSLVAATYLAKAGASVLVLEATSKVGGGLATEELTLPLFRSNIHAHFVRWQPDNPVWRDLRIDRFGVRTIFPEVQGGIVFDDGRDALMHYRDVGRSAAAIARINTPDAEAYRRLFDECSDLSRRLIGPLRFAPPIPLDEEHELLSRSVLGRRYLELAKTSALDLILEWFQSEPVRILVGFNVAVRGYQPVMNVAGTGYAAAVALPASSQAQLVEGGTSEIARGLAAALYKEGGRVVTKALATKIDVQNGRATGVTLADGRSVRAERFVASSVPAPITLLELVGADHLDASLVADLAQYRWNTDYALFGFHFALRDRPRFMAEMRAPDLPYAHDIALGYRGISDLVTEIECVRRGEVGPFRVQTTIPSIHDPSQAPPDHHLAFGWKVVPPGYDDDGKLVNQMLSGYSTYAPNLGGQLLAAAGYSPADIDRAFRSMPRGDHLHGSFHPDNWAYRRPHPRLSDFRTPIDGLYLCGSSQHPGGGFSGSPGFIAAGVIAKDLDLPIWWSRVDAREVLADLD